MNIPAYASPNLRIGRSYDAQTSKAGIDIYPGNIDIEETNVNQFNFEYRVIKYQRYQGPAKHIWWAFSES